MAPLSRWARVKHETCRPGRSPQSSALLLEVQDSGSDCACRRTWISRALVRRLIRLRSPRPCPCYARSRQGQGCSPALRSTCHSDSVSSRTINHASANGLRLLFREPGGHPPRTSASMSCSMVWVLPPPTLPTIRRWRASRSRPSGTDGTSATPCRRPGTRQLQPKRTPSNLGGLLADIPRKGRSARLIQA